MLALMHAGRIGAAVAFVLAGVGGAAAQVPDGSDLVEMARASKANAVFKDVAATARAAGLDYADLLPRLLDANANAYVYLVQDALVQRGEAAPLSGLLDRASIGAIVKFCVGEGIEPVCRAGILTREAASALGAALDGGEMAEEKAAEVVLQCGPVGEYPAFSRVYAAQWRGDQLHLDRGTPGEFGYETWTGRVNDDGVLTLSGEYIEGEGGLKLLDLDAQRADDGSFSGSGIRGPRDCTIAVK